MGQIVKMVIQIKNIMTPIDRSCAETILATPVYYIVWCPQLPCYIVEVNQLRKMAKVRFVNMHHSTWVQLDALKLLI